MTELAVDVSVEGERCVLRLTGELDLETVGELRRSAQEALGGRCSIVAIDMGGLTFLDSSGLGLLVELHNLARASNVTIELVDVPPRQARVFHIAGLNEMFGLPPLDPPTDG